MHVLGVTLGEAKSLGFRKRALLELDESELQVGGVGGWGRKRRRGSRVVLDQRSWAQAAGDPACGREMSPGTLQRSPAGPRRACARAPCDCGPRCRSHRSPSRQSRLELVASTVGVPVDQAKRMAAIQPNLLLDAKVRWRIAMRAPRPRGKALRGKGQTDAATQPSCACARVGPFGSL